eukprot:scaffold277113_cov42-Prasinocladus_malaysianus.AAC.2
MTSGRPVRFRAVMLRRTLIRGKTVKQGLEKAGARFGRRHGAMFSGGGEDVCQSSERQTTRLGTFQQSTTQVIWHFS